MTLLSIPFAVAMSWDETPLYLAAIEGRLCPRSTMWNLPERRELEGAGEIPVLDPGSPPTAAGTMSSCPIRIRLGFLNELASVMT